MVIYRVFDQQKHGVLNNTHMYGIEFLTLFKWASPLFKQFAVIFGRLSKILSRCPKWDALDILWPGKRPWVVTKQLSSKKLLQRAVFFNHPHFIAWHRSCPTLLDMCIYICTHTYGYTCTPIHTHISYMYIYIYTHVNIYIHMYMYIFMCK